MVSGAAYLMFAALYPMSGVRAPYFTLWLTLLHGTVTISTGSLALDKLEIY